jgi:hypothetical protein
MKDKELKFEEDKDPHTLGGGSYILSLYINSVKEVVSHVILSLYINSVKEVVSHVEVELYKPRRYISLTTDSDRDWVWIR